MFLNKVMQNDPKLVETAVAFHQAGKILPDTFVVDVDQFLENAKNMLQEAQKQHIQLYYMLKQIGRNPYLAQQLEKIGYPGAVAVDWKEAEVLMKNHCHICHAGHLVQPPFGFADRLVQYGADYITVYSIEKIHEINRAAEKAGKIQKLMIRVIGEKDLIYSGQTAGFLLSDLKEVSDEVKGLKNVVIAGVDSFPCYLYDKKTKDIQPQENLNTVLEAKKILEGLGCRIDNVNAPSATCCRTLQKMAGTAITSAEPGHGLTGTTPYHAIHDSVEKQCTLYLTEVSHNLSGKAFAFGGGYYRRGHIKNALVGKDPHKMEKAIVTPPSMESIDYHFELDRQFPVASSVIMAYRFQIFVSRSDVCLISGIQKGDPQIIGVYSSLGEKKDDE